jgi:hypothetical protein
MVLKRKMEMLEGFIRLHQIRQNENERAARASLVWY